MARPHPCRRTFRHGNSSPSVHSVHLVLLAAGLLAASAAEGRRPCMRGPAWEEGKALFAAPKRSAGSLDSVEKVRGLVVLADFPDANSTIPKQDMEDLANLPGYSKYSNKGSLRDYFLAVSNGRFDYSLEVVDYVRVPRTKAYYDAASGGEDEFVKDVLKGADDQGCDFTRLSQKNGAVRSVNILYAGGWGEDALWPHQGSVSGVKHDGVSVTRYQMTGLESSPSIGPILHENGHLLFGWPDLYDTDDNSHGAGRFCLMSNEDFKNPCPPNPWLRQKQGWTIATEITIAMPGRTFSAPSNGRSLFRFVNPAKAGESFFIEAVARTGRWATWPDQGLAIWHVDEGGDNDRQEMTASSHYKVSMEQADGLFDLEKNRNGGGSGDLFKGGGRAAFGDATVPDSKWWIGTASGLEIVEISPVMDTMTFRLKGPPVGVLAGRGDGSGGRGYRMPGMGEAGAGTGKPAAQPLWAGPGSSKVRTDGRRAARAD